MKSARYIPVASVQSDFSSLETFDLWILLEWGCSYRMVRSFLTTKKERNETCQWHTRQCFVFGFSLDLRPGCLSIQSLTTWESLDPSPHPLLTSCIPLPGTTPTTLFSSGCFADKSRVPLTILSITDGSAADNAADQPSCLRRRNYSFFSLHAYPFEGKNIWYVNVIRP